MVRDLVELMDVSLKKKQVGIACYVHTNSIVLNNLNV